MVPAADDDIRLGIGLEVDADLGSLPRANSLFSWAGKGLCRNLMGSAISICIRAQKALNLSQPEASTSQSKRIQFAGLHAEEGLLSIGPGKLQTTWPLCLSCNLQFTKLYVSRRG